MEGGGPLVVAGGSEPDDTDVDSVDEESRAYDDQEGEEEWPRRSLKAASREASVPLAQGVRTDLLCHGLPTHIETLRVLGGRPNKTHPNTSPNINRCPLMNPALHASHVARSFLLTYLEPPPLSTVHCSPTPPK